MYNGNWDHMGGWWIPMMFMMIAFWAGLLWLATSVIRRPNHNLRSAWQGLVATPASPVPPEKTAQEILAERLARGDIEPDDYRQRLDALNHRSGS